MPEQSATQQPSEGVVVRGEATRHQPNWRLCLWWVVLSTAGSFIGMALATVWLVVNDATRAYSAFYIALFGWVSMFTPVMVALLQAPLLKGYGVKVSHWLIVAFVGAFASTVLVVPWLDFLDGVLGTYAPGREWVPFVGPVLESLPVVFLVSTLQGFVLARGAAKSRLGWWVLASTLGYVIGSLIAPFVGMFVLGVVYVSAPDLSTVAVIPTQLLSSALVYGAIYSLAQGVTLALFFRRSAQQMYQQTQPVQLPLA